MNYKNLTLIIVLVSICTGVYAQQSLPGVNITDHHPQTQRSFYEQLNRHAGSHNRHPAVDTASRLIARRTDTIGGAGPVYRDSSFLTYSGAHSGDDNVIYIEFDQEQYLHATGGAWSPTQRTVQTFNSNDDVISSTTQSYSAGAWVNQAMLTSIYSSGDDDSVDVNYTWTGTAWQPTDSTSNPSYDALHNTQVTLAYSLLTPGNTWEENYKMEFTYDANGSQTSIVHYNGSSNGWVNDTRYTTTYTSFEQPLTELWENYGSNGWVNRSLAAFTYDADSNFITKTGQEWLLNQWSNTDMDARSYDVYHNLLTDSIYAVAQGVAWSLARAYTYGYDNSNNEVLATYRYLEPWSNTFGSQSAYTYNSHNQYLTQTYSVLDSSSNTFNPQTKYSWWYGDRSTSGIAEVTKDIASTVYPVPFDRSFTIAFDAQTAGPAALYLYDINGKLVTHTTTTVTAGSNTIPWNAGYKLPAGVYTYRLTTGNESSTGKVVSE